MPACNPTNAAGILRPSQGAPPQELARLLPCPPPLLLLLLLQLLVDHLCRVTLPPAAAQTQHAR
jgi:hypothetical protein